MQFQSIRKTLLSVDSVYTSCREQVVALKAFTISITFINLQWIPGGIDVPNLSTIRIG